MPYTMSESTDLVVNEVDQGVAILRLNRPDSLNALSKKMCDAIVESVSNARNNLEVNVIVMTGTGKAFSAGVDLKELTENPAVLSDDSAFESVFDECEKPIIGAINGFAITGGLELALKSDFLFASNNAKFGDTHAKVGIMPTWGLSQKLGRLIGIGRARELSLSGDFFNADQACEWGMVNRVYEPENLMEEALKIARKIAQNQPATVKHIKKLINDGWMSTLSHGLELENERSRPHNAELDYSVMEARLSQLRKKS